MEAAPISETRLDRELTLIRTDFNSRFDGLEKWLERLNVSIEKQTETREKMISLEERLFSVKSENDRLSDEVSEVYEAIEALDEKLDLAKLKASEDLTDVKVKLGRMTVYLSVGAFVGGILANYAAKALLGA